jgi:hypothetical protein
MTDYWGLRSTPYSDDSTREAGGGTLQSQSAQQVRSRPSAALAVASHNPRTWICEREPAQARLVSLCSLHPVRPSWTRRVDSSTAVPAWASFVDYLGKNPLPDGRLEGALENAIHLRTDKVRELILHGDQLTHTRCTLEPLAHLCHCAGAARRAHRIRKRPSMPRRSAPAVRAGAFAGCSRFRRGFGMNAP